MIVRTHPIHPSHLNLVPLPSLSPSFYLPSAFVRFAIPVSFPVLFLFFSLYTWMQTGEKKFILGAFVLVPVLLLVLLFASTRWSRSSRLVLSSWV